MPENTWVGLKNWTASLVFEPDCAWLIYKFFQMTPSIYLPDSDRYQQDAAIQPAWLKEL